MNERMYGCMDAWFFIGVSQCVMYTCMCGWMDACYVLYVCMYACLVWMDGCSCVLCIVYHVSCIVYRVMMGVLFLTGIGRLAVRSCWVV